MSRSIHAVQSLLLVDLTAVNDSVQREKLWANLHNFHAPKSCSQLLGYVPESVYILTDGGKVLDGIMANQGLKKGCQLSPKLSFHKTT